MTEEKYEELEQSLEKLRGKLLSLQLGFLSTCVVAISVNAAQGIKTKDIIIESLETIFKAIEDDNTDPTDPFIKSFKKTNETLRDLIEKMGSKSEEVSYRLYTNQRQDQ